MRLFVFCDFVNRILARLHPVESEISFVVATGLSADSVSEQTQVESATVVRSFSSTRRERRRSLVCGSHSAHLAASLIAASPDLIHALTNVMEIPLRGLQSSHLVGGNTKSQDELVDYQLTNEFLVRFPASRIKGGGAVGRFANPCHNQLDEHRLATITISNPTNTTAYAKIPNAAPNFIFRIVSLNNGALPQIPKVSLKKTNSESA